MQTRGRDGAVPGSRVGRPRRVRRVAGEAATTVPAFLSVTCTRGLDRRSGQPRATTLTAPLPWPFALALRHGPRPPGRARRSPRPPPPRYGLPCHPPTVEAPVPELSDLYDAGKDGVVLRVHVQPGAGRSAVVGRHGDSLKVRIAAPPVGGRANEATLALLAEVLGLASADVELTGGESS